MRGAGGSTREELTVPPSAGAGSHPVFAYDEEPLGLSDTRTSRLGKFISPTYFISFRPVSFGRDFIYSLDVTGMSVDRGTSPRRVNATT